jgi:arginase
MTQRAAIGVVGVPIESGASERGARMGPDALRTAGLIEAFADLGRTVVDHGDLGVPRPGNGATNTAAGKQRNLSDVTAVVRTLADRAASIARRGEVPVVLGGDHSLAMGSVAGVARHFGDARRELFVLWLDAHADFNTPATSPTGNLHGMPTAFLCGEPGFEGLLDDPAPIINPRNLTIFGLRSVDREERALLRTRGVQVIDMRVIDEIGVPALVRKLLEEVASRRGALHVSLDADFIDPALAPGVGTPVPGGVTYREAHLVMEMLCDSGLVASLDLVELNPYRDDRGKTARLLVELTASLFGRQIFHHSAAP